MKMIKGMFSLVLEADFCLLIQQSSSYQSDVLDTNMRIMSEMLATSYLGTTIKVLHWKIQFYISISLDFPEAKSHVQLEIISWSNNALTSQ